MPRSDATAPRARRAALASGLVASALLALAGCVPLPPPLPTDEPTATSELDVELCPATVGDHMARLLTGDASATGASMRARAADHPVALPVGDADVGCAVTLDDGSAVYTLLLLRGNAVPQQVRAAAAGLQVVEDRIDTGGNWVAHAPDYTSSVVLGRPDPLLIADIMAVGGGPAWTMQAVAPAP